MTKWGKSANSGRKTNSSVWKSMIWRQWTARWRPSWQRHRIALNPIRTSSPISISNWTKSHPTQPVWYQEHLPKARSALSSVVGQRRRSLRYCQEDNLQRRSNLVSLQLIDWLEVQHLFLEQAPEPQLYKNHHRLANHWRDTKAQLLLNAAWLLLKEQGLLELQQLQTFHRVLHNHVYEIHNLHQLVLSRPHQFKLAHRKKTVLATLLRALQINHNLYQNTQKCYTNSNRNKNGR